MKKQTKENRGRKKASIRAMRLSIDGKAVREVIAYILRKEGLPTDEANILERYKTLTPTEVVTLFMDLLRKDLFAVENMRYAAPPVAIAPQPEPEPEPEPKPIGLDASLIDDDDLDNLLGDF